MQNVLRAMRKKPRILDFASDSSDEDVAAMKVTKLRKDFDESDDESMGSDEDDMLRRASIYTIQESLKLSIGKLDKVRSLYEMQAQHLNYFLKERRRKYLADLRKEREVHCSIHDQAKNTSKERLFYNKLKLLTRYHRRHGHEAVLYRKYKEKRTKSYDLQKAPSHPKCVFTEGGVKCGDRTIPCSKFCRKHILEDKKQTLFRACLVEKSNVVCHEPTICIGEDTNCMLHLFIPPKQQYTQKKNDSETEDEDATLKAITTNASLATTPLTTAAAAAKILKNVAESVDVNEMLIKTKSTTANVEVVPIDATASVAQQTLKTESMKTKLQQQEETIKKVLQNSPKSITRRQQKRHNNRRKPWTSKPKKRLQPETEQQQQQQHKSSITTTDDKKIDKNVVKTTITTTTNTTTKLLTLPTITKTTTTTTTTAAVNKLTITKTTIGNIDKSSSSQQQQQQQHGGGVIIKKKPLEIIKHQHHHQSPALLQQQQQIEKQLQKQQVQQSAPQIFQIQNQQQQSQQPSQQQQQPQLLPFKRIIPQLQQQAQQKTLSLANVKQIINLHQLQTQQQTKLPTTTTTVTTTTPATNVKQFINLPTQQQKHITPILMRLPTTAAATTNQIATTLSTTAITTIKTNVTPQQQKQVIQLPVQRTTRFQFQQAAITTTTIPPTTTSTIATSSVGGSGNITYHTIPGLPKSTSVIINKQYLPKTAIVGVQKQQQQQHEQVQNLIQQQNKNSNNITTTNKMPKMLKLNEQQQQQQQQQLTFKSRKLVDEQKLITSSSSLSSTLTSFLSSTTLPFVKGTTTTNTTSASTTTTPTITIRKGLTGAKKLVVKPIQMVDLKQICYLKYNRGERQQLQ